MASQGSGGETDMKGKISGFLASMTDDTDFKIQLGPYTWKVHADLIAQHSQFFKKVRDGEWKESKEGVVKLHDDHPWIFARFLQFVYLGDYDFSQKSEDMVNDALPLARLLESGRTEPDYNRRKNEDLYTSTSHYFLIHLRVYELADKYDSPHLRAHISHGLEQHTTCPRDMSYLAEEENGKWDDFCQSVMRRDGIFKEAMVKYAASVYPCCKDYPVGSMISRWMKSDHDFWVMLTDNMAEVIVFLNDLRAAQDERPYWAVD
ncbi:hypothetical protein PMZ80_004227 [Knufia obscura]|uniref:BTB domain-containing protein n=1 Tax=Knufia obscura TaxID=1635080 RepID=A0ABR0RSI8_9EURO|nr:hypothetical protein PMZ80_004227 [Knufia obscura]